MTTKITFLGAARNVTGSKYLVEVQGRRILVDCGLYQERKLKDRNWEIFPVTPSSIDTILLTHAHLDHVGYLPRLARDGFSGNVHCTPATAGIAKIVLLDSGHIQEEDAARKQRRHRRQKRKGPHPVEPLYTQEDADRCQSLFVPVSYNTPLDLGGGMEATFHDAGHILGSSMISLRLPVGGEKKTLLFSGDVGRWDKPILRDPSLIEEADYLVVESTYGNREHKDEAPVEDIIAEAVNEAVSGGGNLLIPSFSVERAHEIMYHFNDLLLQKRIPSIPVFLDSPMAIRVTQVFRDHPELFDEEMTALWNSDRSPFSFPGLKMTRTANESKGINQIKTPVVVVAGSGMCTGGRIKHHLVQNISRPESIILFTGFQASGTLGRVIVNGTDPVRILGRHFPVRSRIMKAYGFSGHADRSELLRWASALSNPPKTIFVTHGESDAALSFAELLRSKLGGDVRVPEYGDEAELT